MSVLGAGELGSIRREVNATLEDTCTIQRVTITRTADGAEVEAWTTLASAVPCRVAPSGYQTSEPVVGGQQVQQATYIVTLQADTDITARDRILWNGRTFNVVSVVPRTLELARRVYVAETF